MHVVISIDLTGESELALWDSGTLVKKHVNYHVTVCIRVEAQAK